MAQRSRCPYVLQVDAQPPSHNTQQSQQAVSQALLAHADRSLVTPTGGGHQHRRGGACVPGGAVGGHQPAARGAAADARRHARRHQRPRRRHQGRPGGGGDTQIDAYLLSAAVTTPGLCSQMSMR